MKRFKFTGVALIGIFMLFGGVNALGAGYPMAVVAASGSTKIVVIGSFASGSGQFSQTDAENLTASIAPIMQSLLSGLIASSPYVFTPSQLAAAGLGDADALKTLVKTNYKAWDFSYFIYVPISMTAQYAAGFGPNMRMDFYVADLASQVSVTADYLYALSIEVPYMYTSLLSLF